MPLYPANLETARPDLVGTINQFNPLDPKAYIADKIFTPYKVETPTNVIPYSKAENMLARDETNISAPGTTANRDSAEFDSATYNCKRNKRDAEITEEAQARIGDIVELEKTESSRIANILLTNRDLRLVKTVVNETYMALGTDGEQAGVLWSTAASADARKDMASAIAKGATRCGMDYQVAVMSDLQIRQLWAQEKLRQSFSGVQVVGNEDPYNDASRKQLAGQLGLRDIWVCNTMYNTAVQGSALVAARAWPINYVLLLNPAGSEKGLRTGFGNMFYHPKQGGLMDVRAFYDPDNERDILRVGEAIDMKVIVKNCGYLLKVNGF